MSTSDQAECFFEYRQVGSSTWTETVRQTFDSPVSFTDLVGGLVEGTEYEYRAVAEAGTERATGDIIQFVATDEGTESTGDAYVSNVTAFSATLNIGLGEIRSDLVEVWFRYRPVGSTTWLETEKHVMDGPGSFPGGDISDLMDDTEYEYQGMLRTYVQSNSVDVGTPTNIGFDGATLHATLHGELTKLYGPPDTTVGFVYGPAGSDLSDPTLAGVEEVEAGTLADPGTFETDITGLDDGTDYDAIAFSQATILSGSPTTYSFRTHPAIAVEGVTATNIGETSATLRGDLTHLYFNSAEASFEYREVGATTWTQTTTHMRTTTGEYEIDISRLSADTEYEWRARVDVPSEGRTVTGATFTFSTASGAQINLAPYAPNWVGTLRASNPDDYRAAFPTQDETSYAGQTGDIADGIEAASTNNALADLGVGNEYYLGRTAYAYGTHFGVVGVDCTIHFDRNDIAWMLEPTCDIVVIGDVDFVLDTTVDADAGLLGARVQQELWMEDVTLHGHRNQPASSSPNNYTIRPHLESSDATGYMLNVRLPDGEYYSGTGTPSGGERTLGFSTDPTPDPGHIGQLLMENCFASGFLGNNFYISMNPHDGTTLSDGETVLLDCEARNGNRGNIRVGYNDKVIGGRTDVSDMPGDLQGQPLVCDYATNENNPTEIIGLEITGNDYQGNAIQFRNHDYPDGGHIEMEKVLMDVNGPNAPFRMSEGDQGILNVDIRDSYFHYHYPDTYNQVIDIWSGDMSIPESDLNILNDDDKEIEVHSGGSLTVGNTTYSPGTYSAGALGLDSVRSEDFPSVYINFNE